MLYSHGFSFLGMELFAKCLKIYSFKYFFSFLGLYVFSWSGNLLYKYIALYIVVCFSLVEFVCLITIGLRVFLTFICLLMLKVISSVIVFGQFSNKHLWMNIIVSVINI